MLVDRENILGLSPSLFASWRAWFLAVRLGLVAVPLSWWSRGEFQRMMTSCWKTRMSITRVYKQQLVLPRHSELLPRNPSIRDNAMGIIRLTQGFFFLIGWYRRDTLSSRLSQSALAPTDVTAVMLSQLESTSRGASEFHNNPDTNYSLINSDKINL